VTTEIKQTQSILPLNNVGFKVYFKKHPDHIPKEKLQKQLLWRGYRQDTTSSDNLAIYNTRFKYQTALISGLWC